MATYATIKDHEEQLCNISSGDAYIDSTLQGEDILIAVRKTLYRYDWPEMMKRYADVIIANVDRYSLQTDFRKFRFLFAEVDLKKEVDLDYLPFSRHKFAIARDTGEYILSEQPSSDSTEYTTQNDETAGNTVVVELDTVDGLAAGDEIWIDGTAGKEFTVIQSVDTDNVTITIKFANNITAGDIIYKITEIIYFAYMKESAATSAIIVTGTATPEGPEELHLVIPHYAAYLYFKRQGDDERAKLHYEVWSDEIRDIWLSHGKQSSGPSNQFSI